MGREPRELDLTLQSCCPCESSSKGCLLKHLEQAKSAADVDEPPTEEATADAILEDEEN